MTQIQGSTILVTGGAGFIGSHLCDNLLEQGYQVVALDNLRNGSLENLKDASTNKAFRFIEGDILDKDTCQEALKNVDYVYHLACLGVRHSLHSPFENHQVNAEGTLRVLEAALEAKVKHFYYISTSEVYGKTTDFPIVETSPTKPTTVYGASKLAGEHYTQAYNECFGMKTTVLRIFNNYGPRAHYEGDAGEVIPRTIVKVLYGEQPVIFGDGSVTRDFFFVKDTARALSSLMFIDGLNGLTINIGTGEEITIKTLIEKLLHLLDKTDLGIRYLPDRPADVPRLWVKSDKFKEVTSFKADYTFEKGLAETIPYYKDKVGQKNLLEEIQDQNWEK